MKKKYLFFLLGLIFTFFQTSSQNNVNGAITLPSGNFQSDYFFDSASNQMWFSFIADKPRMTFSLMHSANYTKSQNITLDSLVLYSVTNAGGINSIAFSLAPNANSDTLSAIQILNLVPGNTYYLKPTKFNAGSSGYFNLSKIVLHPTIIPPSCNVSCPLGVNLVCNGDFEILPSWVSLDTYVDSSPTYPNAPPLPAAIGYCIKSPNIRSDFRSLGDSTDTYLISNYMSGSDMQNTAEHGSYFMGVDCPSALCSECSLHNTAGYIWTPNYTATSWEENIPIENGVKYIFSCWLEDLDNYTYRSFPGANVFIVINSDTLFSDVISYPNNYGSWQQVTFCWNANSSVANIQIIGQGAANSQGYDFGLDNISFTSTNSFTITTKITSISCNEDSTGSAMVVASGGSSPYTYYWSTSPAQTTQQATGLSAGTYTVIVSDSTSCQSEISVTISPLADSLKSTWSTCCNCKGAAWVYPYAGNSPYTFLWSNGATTDTAIGLSSGTYTVAITDSAGCIHTDTVFVPTGFFARISQDNISCYGGSNGSATVLLSGNYSYNWAPNGGTEATISGLSAGTYSVTITNNDTSNCSVTYLVTITQPITPLSVILSNPYSICTIYPTVYASVSGGTPAYTYNWGYGSHTDSEMVNNVCPYGYSYDNLTVKDSKGCSVSTFIDINEPIDWPTFYYYPTDNNVSCHGGNDGSITVATCIFSGTPPFYYNISPGGSYYSYNTNYTYSNLISGTYTISVTDYNGCTTPTVIVTITEPPAIVVTTTVTAATCTANGIATASASNGVSPYTYIWSGGHGSNTTASGLSVGTYTISVTDHNGCTGSATAIVTQPTQLNVSANTNNNVTCYGDSNGSASSIISGGTSPYAYLWSNSQTKYSITGLSSGTYSLTVTDFCGSSATVSIIITQPTQLNASANTLDNVNCFSGNNGSASSTVSGGTPPYTYLWSNSQTTPTLSGLSMGTYTVNVTDNNGCTGSANVIITQPNQLNVSASTITNVNCFGGSNGSASSTVIGGTLPYTYLWAGGNSQTTVNAGGLSMGTYTVNVTDNNGCASSASTSITQPNQLNVSANSVNNVSCNGDSNGSASSNISGGTLPYTYAWSNSQTLANINGLSSGTYTLIVADSCGSSATASTIITQPSAVSIIADSLPDNGSCTGSAWAMVSGGNNPYTYLWTGGLTTDTIQNQCAGNYCCVITDLNRCIDSICVTIPLIITTGIEGLNNSFPIQIIPNPNGGVFTIVFLNTPNNLHVEIYDVLGEEIYASRLNLKRTEINLNSEPDGVYFYRVLKENSGFFGSGKLIIER